MNWALMLAYITGTVDQELLLRNEYLAAENRILRAQIKGRLLLSDAEKATLRRSRIGSDATRWRNWRLLPDRRRLAWYRKRIAKKFDGSMYQIMRSSANRRRNGAVGGADGEGKSGMGL
jgi:hypothetical protein